MGITVAPNRLPTPFSPYIHSCRRCQHTPPLSLRATAVTFWLLPMHETSDLAITPSVRDEAHTHGRMIWDKRWRNLRVFHPYLQLLSEYVSQYRNPDQQVLRLICSISRGLSDTVGVATQYGRSQKQPTRAAEELPCNVRTDLCLQRDAETNARTK